MLDKFFDNWKAFTIFIIGFIVGGGACWVAKDFKFVVFGVFALIILYFILGRIYKSIKGSISIE